MSMLDITYFEAKIIGSSNEQPGCSELCFMHDNANKSKDRYIRGVESIIKSATDSVHPQGSQKINDIISYIEDQYVPAATKMFVDHKLLFNSILCENQEGCSKRTGNQSFPAPFKFLEVESREIDGFASLESQEVKIDVDFSTAQTYTKELLDNYQKSHIEFQCAVKKLTALFYDMRMGEGDVAPQAPINGYCQPYNPGGRG